MNQVENKPTREELKERLRMAQMRGKLGRMPKKQREEKVEKIKTQMDEQQKAIMEQIHKLTPEQRKAMGIPENFQVPNQTPIADNENNKSENEMENNVQKVNPENSITATDNNPLTIPLQLPRMKPIVKQEPELINIHNKKLEI
jgi:hypothetical protein